MSLRERWPRVVAQVAGTMPISTEHTEQAARDLLRRWSSPERGYHDLQHLRETLAALDELVAAEEGGADDADADTVALAELALWFHDAVYDPRARGTRNERDSAQLAREVLTSLGAATSVADEVARLVLLTADHRVEDPTDTAGRLVSDADLWILAAPPERYASYTAAVRQEYRHVPGVLFRRGRRTVLEGLLATGTPYVTDHARDVWGPRALANVRAEIQQLG
ncbi:hypothetical protein ACH0CA_07555 [Kytococcus sedentarius]|uniref:hypothetical protein n=1 Tax=Kytococcus sedentarius TaxID=1276 RepID=UPI00387947EB